MPKDVTKSASTSKEIAPNSAKISKSRFILFVGNLPFDITADRLRKHFQTAEPIKSVRLLTDKETKKPRGIAFIDFEDVNGFLSGLKLHQSKLKGRVINVEKTAGGGGNSEKRRQKLALRNKKNM